MKKNYLAYEDSEIKFSERNEAVRALEEERLRLTEEAEAIVREYAKILGKKELSRRSKPVGYAQNDYGFFENRKKY